MSIYSPSRRGSALLIVLGMLTFMLFSGLAFSVFMRETRLPSSFLRRTTMVRELAHAALAEAMVDIDAAMGNQPYVNQNGLYWDHRVLILTNMTSSTQDTVPTLNMESLAYVPPPLLNDVRHYSRKTFTAMWRPFDFDAGRFAFTVVDVSDYFDVNRILANRSRGAAPSRRVSFAYLFEGSARGELHGEPIPGAAAKWDDWMANVAKARRVNAGTGEISFTGGAMPFVSIADFNLALGERVIGKLKSPFIRYLNNAVGDIYDDTDGDPEDEIACAYRSMTFVTDSYQPRTVELDPDGKPVKVADLSREADQPFSYEDLTSDEKNARGFNKIFTYNKRSSVWDNHYRNFLCDIGMAQLCDYLDVDSVPTSLAIPTVERVPMIAAIRVQSANDAQLCFAMEKGQLSAEGESTTGGRSQKRTATREDTYCLDGAALLKGNSSIDLAGVFPFVHVNRDELPRWMVDGKLLLYFTVEGHDVPLVINEDSRSSLFTTSGKQSGKGLALGEDDWKSEEVVFANDRGVLVFPFRPQNNAFAKFSGAFEEPKEDADSVASCSIRIDSGSRVMERYLTIDPKKGFYFMKVTRKWDQTRPDKDKEWEPADPPAGAEITKVESRMPIIKETGEAANQEEMKELLRAGRLKLNAAVTVRVRDEDKHTVDLVPAGFRDDIEQGLVDNYRSNTKFRQRLPFYDSVGPRFLKLKLSDEEGGAGRALSLAEIDAACALANDRRMSRKIDFGKSVMMVEDPRYNHNPESWYRIEGEEDSDIARIWFENCHASDLGRDGDIYMSVSDQGYLQSPYELAYLSRCTDAIVADSRPYEESGTVERGGANEFYGAWDKPACTRTEILDAKDRAKALNHRLMWRTYRPYGEDADDFEGMRVISGAGGFKVNPFASSPEILMAAFANTPRDWRTCSTNEEMNPLAAAEIPVEEFNRKNAWNAYSEDETTRIKWDDLMAIAENFSGQSRKSGDWLGVFENLGWESADRHNLAGVDLESDVRITSVDRRFFYGFWRDCFDASQQLFLVFLRAEPMMMGGGVAATVPPQLGTRAVAVVWRDPTPTPNGEPHRMRVLFYHSVD